MADDFVIARNPEEGTSLPYLVRIPLGVDGIVLKVREMWPRTSKVYCHRASWPEDPEILEQVPTTSCTKRGAASTWSSTVAARTAPSSSSPWLAAGR